jgi:hypothetical protein
MGKVRSRCRCKIGRRHAAVLALDILLDGIGADGHDGSEEGGESCELHLDVWNRGLKSRFGKGLLRVVQIR